MKQKHKIINRFTVCLLVVLVIALAVLTVFIVKSDAGKVATASKVASAKLTSQFSFTGAAGWQQGATNKTSMALFHRTDGCFTSVQHKTGTIDANEAKLQKTQAYLTSNGHTITPGATQVLTMQTPAGSQKYNLHQSVVTNPNDTTNKVAGGQEFGYLQLSDGYLFVEGYCSTAEELPATIPALQAIKFDPAN